MFIQIRGFSHPLLEYHQHVQAVCLIKKTLLVHHVDVSAILYISRYFLARLYEEFNFLRVKILPFFEQLFLYYCMFFVLH